jgi:hypothetical protein
MQPDIFEAEDMFRGETRQEGITVTRTDGQALVIASATYQIFDWAGVSQGEAAAATVDGGNVYANIVAGSVTGGRYVEFTYTVGSWTRKARKRYRVI